MKDTPVSIDIGEIGSEMLAAAVVAFIRSVMRKYGIFLDGKLEGNVFKFDAYLAGKKVMWGELHFEGAGGKSRRSSS